MWRENDARNMAVCVKSTTVVVMTKEPIEGRVKTRLIPDMGAAAATALHVAMVQETIVRAQQSGLPVCVSLDGNTQSSFARDLRHLGVAVEAQVEGDLGVRLSNATRSAGQTLFLGTDCVLFEPEWLRQACQAEEAVTIGPADDGGYWLIGIDRTEYDLRPIVFEHMAWSTASVCAETVARVRRANHSIHWLPSCYDVDTINDVFRLQHDPACPHHIRDVIDAIVPTAR